MAKPGPNNLISDVSGIRIGNAEDAIALTGVTVILAGSRCVAAVDTRGGAPGTRETDALRPSGLNVGVDAIVLSGGSVYGLEAASTVTALLGAAGRGYALGDSKLVAPIVPAAILFDLTNGGDKSWGETPPYSRLARIATAGASREFVLGNAGAGFGARAGAYKGGLGSASWVTPDGIQIGAIAAVNSFGSPVIPGTHTLWAWPFEQQAEMGGQIAPERPIGGLGLPPDVKGLPQTMSNTTIAVVATNVALTPAQAERMAIMAHDGMARALRPVHAPVDGDVVFALSTGELPMPEPWQLTLTGLGSLAADCLARAIGRGVFAAESLGAWKSYREACPSGFTSAF
jgi:L-aminopeptidase/D-esterase-like protein